MKSGKGKIPIEGMLSAVSSQASENNLTPNPSPGGKGRRGKGEYSPKLMIRTHQTDQAVTIEIQDNGPGIPGDIKDKILQPFFTTKKGTAGTGLGLSITNDIVKAHGSKIDIHSSGTGSSFNIFIPSREPFICHVLI